MGAGLAITGAAAYGTFHAAVDASGALTPFGNTIFVSPLKWALILAPLALVMFLSFRIEKMSVSAAQTTVAGRSGRGHRGGSSSARC